MSKASWTIEQLNSLEEAIAQGALMVKYQDKEVQYRSLADMMAVRAIMRRALGITSNQAGRIYLKHRNALGRSSVANSNTVANSGIQYSDDSQSNFQVPDGECEEE